jgi:4-alpha-glucanotransferase
VEAVPEWRHSETARALPESERLQKTLADLRSATQVDYDHVIALKERILTELHRTFRDRAEAGGERRGRDFAEFTKQREPELARYATWMTIAENAGTPDWRRWPESLREPESATVRAFQKAHADRVDFYRWLQFETHRQLAEVASRARTLGMRIGVYQDLAIGSNPGGSDTWSYPDLFLTDAAIGAPPDPYSSMGQNWGLPPIDPRALRQQGYRYWIQVIRHAFENAGALRIDHVMGLFRSYWIPDGATGRDGAYVRFPARDLLGILALESVRHDALVVGEDLGTVPPEVPAALKKWGILSSKVLVFERDNNGFRPPSRYAPLALATANTHDMAPLAGFWTGRDVELRAQVGLLATPREVRQAMQERAEDKQALLRLLNLSVPAGHEGKDFLRRLVAAVHEFLCSTRAYLVGLSLDDLMSEREPVNVPGVGPEKFPSWRRKTRMTIEAVSWNFEVDDAMGCTGRRAAD